MATMLNQVGNPTPPKRSSSEMVDSRSSFDLPPGNGCPSKDVPALISADSTSFREAPGTELDDSTDDDAGIVVPANYPDDSGSPARFRLAQRSGSCNDDDDDASSEGGSVSEGKAKGSPDAHKSWLGTQLAPIFSYDHETFIFSIRLAASMTLASLFTLAFNPSDPLPNAAWVVTSAVIVSWQEQLDTASYVKKAAEIIGGTVLGAAFGLAAGFLADVTRTRHAEAIVLGSLIAMFSFAVPYMSTRLGLRGNHGARLGLITFGVVALAFYSTPDPSRPVYMMGVWRASNIVFGCIVSCLSLFLWPVSTKHLIVDTIKKQMRLAGETADNVLTLSYASFVNKQSPPQFYQYLRVGYNLEEDADEAFQAYSKGTGAWKGCNALFANLKFDPMFRSLPQRERDRFQANMPIILYRAFRIQVNLIMLDSIVRGGVLVDEYPDSFDVLRDIGRRTKIALNLDNELAKRETAVNELAELDLVRVRFHLNSLRKQLAFQSTFATDIKEVASSTNFLDERPLRVLENREQMALFFQLLEHLILRVSRLHYFAACDL